MSLCPRDIIGFETLSPDPGFLGTTRIFLVLAPQQKPSLTDKIFIDFRRHAKKHPTTSLKANTYRSYSLHIKDNYSILVLNKLKKTGIFQKPQRLPIPQTKFIQIPN